MAGASIAGTNGIRKDRCLERGAHECFCRVGEIGSAGRGVGQDIALVELLAANLFLHLGFDGVEGQVFPAMLGLELGEGEAVLQTTSNLYNGCI